jgi:rhodanese-related sulfurtransferase
MLVFAKFVPGINTMAPPLAGSMNMPVVQFLGLDLAGVALYTAAYLSVGFLASGAIEKITRGSHTAARLMSWIFIALLIGYVGYQIWTWRKSRGLRLVPSVTPHEAAEALSADLAVIYDVRSHGYYDRDAMRVKGSRRLDPNALRPGQQDFPVDRRIYLYCTCVRQATSARVAQVLLRNGLPGAVIQGGLEAWKKAGLPLEPIPLDEIAVMPLFNS